MNSARSMSAQDLQRLYVLDDFALNAIDGAEDLFFERLRCELIEEEEVLALAPFKSLFRAYIMAKPDWRAALLVVTSQRVLHIAAQPRFLGRHMPARQQAKSAAELQVWFAQYSDMTGVDGRRTLLSFGTERELYLDLKDGRFHKIQGLAASQSSRLELVIRKAVNAYNDHVASSALGDDALATSALDWTIREGVNPDAARQRLLQLANAIDEFLRAPRTGSDEEEEKFFFLLSSGASVGLIFPDEQIPELVERDMPIGAEISESLEFLRTLAGRLRFIVAKIRPSSPDASI